MPSVSYNTMRSQITWKEYLLPFYATIWAFLHVKEAAFHGSQKK